MTRDEALGIIDEILDDLELANPDVPGVPIFVLIDDEKNTTLHVLFEDKAIEDIVVAYEKEADDSSIEELEAAGFEVTIIDYDDGEEEDE